MILTSWHAAPLQALGEQHPSTLTSESLVGEVDLALCLDVRADSTWLEPLEAASLQHLLASIFVC